MIKESKPNFSKSNFIALNISSKKNCFFVKNASFYHASFMFDNTLSFNFADLQGLAAGVDTLQLYICRHMLGPDKIMHHIRVWLLVSVLWICF